MSMAMPNVSAKITVQTQGEQDITHLQNAVRDLTKQVKDFAAQAGTGGNAAAQMAREAQQAARVTTGMGNSTRMAGHHVQNLGYQINDVIVSLSSGQKPMTVFMQQGAQIGQIMAAAGGGVRGLASELLALAAPFAPVIAAAAALGVGVAVLTDEINNNAKVHVTWQDTLLGAYDVVSKYISDELTSAFAYFGMTSGEVWKQVVSVTKWAVNAMIGITTLAPRLMITAFEVLPGAMASLMTQAANGVISAINWMIRKAVDGLNVFINGSNVILSKVGWSIGTLSAPQLDHVKNNYAGAGAKAGKAFIGTLKATVTTDYVGGLADAIGDAAQKRASARIASATKGGAKGGKSSGGSKGGKAGKADEQKPDYSAQDEALSQGARSALGMVGQTLNAIEQMRAAQEATWQGQSLRALDDYANNVADLGRNAYEAWSNALSGTEDALVSFVTTGKLSFKDLANSIIRDIARIAIQQAIMKPLTSFLGGLFGNGAAFSGGSVVPSALGNVFAGGNVVPFATGGVVGSPTYFPMSAGRTGLMGEAGPEAIMPLRRMANGKLGVQSAGGGGAVVNVNVDAKGSAVQGDGGNAAALGKAIGAAVQAELVRQKRPGGLLAA